MMISLVTTYMAIESDVNAKIKLTVFAKMLFTLSPKKFNFQVN
jgi:hypothetical protein